MVFLSPQGKTLAVVWSEMMNAANVFTYMWSTLRPSEETEVADVMRTILEQKGFFILRNYEELESKARSELNMVNRDEVRQIAAEEYGMIDGPGEER